MPVFILGDVVDRAVGHAVEVHEIVKVGDKTILPLEGVVFGAVLFEADEFCGDK